MTTTSPKWVCLKKGMELQIAYLKVMCDSLHQEIFASKTICILTKEAAMKRKHQNIANVVIKTAAIILK